MPSLFLSIECKSSSIENSDKVGVALKALGEIMAEQSPGTLSYIFFQPDETTWSLREVYSNEDAFAAHLAIEEGKPLIGELVVGSDVSLTCFAIVEGGEDALSEETKKILAGFGTKIRDIGAGFVVNPTADLKSKT